MCGLECVVPVGTKCRLSELDLARIGALQNKNKRVVLSVSFEDHILQVKRNGSNSNSLYSSWRHLIGQNVIQVL